MYQERDNRNSKQLGTPADQSATRWVGLSDADSEVLKRCLTNGILQPDAMFVSVPICLPVPLAQYADDTAEARNYRASWARRVDCIMWRDTVPYVVEIKAEAEHYAIGQVLYYLYHVRNEFQDMRGAQAMILANSVAPGVEEVMQHHNITLCLNRPIENMPSPED